MAFRTWTGGRVDVRIPAFWLLSSFPGRGCRSRALAASQRVGAGIRHLGLRAAHQRSTWNMDGDAISEEGQSRVSNQFGTMAPGERTRYGYRTLQRSQIPARPPEL